LEEKRGGGSTLFLRKAWYNRKGLEGLTLVSIVPKEVKMMEKRLVLYTLPVVVLLFLAMVGLSFSMYYNQVSQLEALYKNFESKKSEIDRLSGELARNKEDIGGYKLKIEQYEQKIKEYEGRVNNLQDEVQDHKKSIQEVKSRVNF